VIKNQIVATMNHDDWAAGEDGSRLLRSADIKINVFVLTDRTFAGLYHNVLFCAPSTLHCSALTVGDIIELGLGLLWAQELIEVESFSDKLLRIQILATLAVHILINSVNFLILRLEPFVMKHTI